ncbi:sigma-70 family RNA polymerase sigma factor [Tenacibaculum sp.]|nr:sigma-70 family RNA polymerase sigma factor [Tenacibaculum sp.]
MKKLESVCEEKIFDQIYKTHIKALYNFMYYKCGNANMSKDFVQESFIKLWDNCAKVTTDKAKSFLFTIARNLFLNDVTHKKIRLKHQESLTRTYTNESPEFLLEEQEFMDKLQRVISELPENQREVFLLNRIDKKKYREIAILLDISIKTVEKRMSLALKYLEKKLAVNYKL